MLYGLAVCAAGETGGVLPLGLDRPLSMTVTAAAAANRSQRDSFRLKHAAATATAATTGAASVHNPSGTEGEYAVLRYCHLFISDVLFVFT